MKRLLTLFTLAALTLSFAACQSEASSNNTAQTQTLAEIKTPEAQASIETPSQTVSQEPEFITIKSYNGDKELIEIEVPYNPERIAVMDMAVLDMLDNYGVADRIVGVSKGSTIEYLQSYMEDDSLLNLGTIKEMSIEKVMECEPDIIFIGGRLSANYNDLSQIAPVVFLSSDTKIGLIESTKINAKTVASIFGIEEKVDGLFTDFDARIAKLQEISKDKTAFVGMLNAGGFNVLGNDGRCSIIGVEIGFENIGLNAEKGESTGSGESTVTSAHGNETSFEYIVRINPDYIFIMNRDDAIGTEGAASAKEVIENELVMTTDAYKNGNIVYLEHSNIWYTAEGGITSLDYMLKDLETNLVK